MATERETARDYYSEKLKQHGATARGVDWPSAASQYLRFAQLLKLCDFNLPFSINDFGCGYGALLEYFEYRQINLAIAYHGVDISPSMIEAAKTLWRHRPLATFTTGCECPGIADYSIASGVFNVKLEWPTEAWERYIESILTDLCAKSRRGFAVNFMLPPDDEPLLYRTRPDRWLDFVARRLDYSPVLVTDYGLREFTLLARAHGAGSH